MTPRKRHDTYPITFTCKDRNGGVDLTNATSITFIATNALTGVVKIEGEAVKDADQTTYPGKATYSPIADDVDTAGKFKVEIEVVWTDTTESTWPSDGYETLVILPDLGTEVLP